MADRAEYTTALKDEEAWVKERFNLAKERIGEIAKGEELAAPFSDFFIKEAKWISIVLEDLETEAHIRDSRTFEAWRERNQRIYEDTAGENYAHSYGNPAYAAEKLGAYGKAFSFLYAELYGLPCYAAEESYWDMTLLMELFLEVYSSFSDDELPSVTTIEKILISYAEDYCQEIVERQVRCAVDPDLDFAQKLIMESDLKDLSYLFRFGEYISSSEMETAEYLNTLSQEEIDAVAETFTQGFYRGFIQGRKDIRKKKTVNLRYRLGFERVMRSAVLKFRKMGLSPVIYRHALHAVVRSAHGRGGYGGGEASRQFEYDHRQDSALFLTADFVQKKLRAIQTSYEKYKDLAKVHAGPAVVEAFGAKPFHPAACEEALHWSEEQTKLHSRMMNETAQITSRYIPSEERSFTIIAFPLPEIDERYPEIFREVMKINTLDNDRYTRIQQTIIDTLDSCEWVEVKGRGDNETDLIVHLHTLTDPKKQTNFENCVADVNIPLGEVFTSPMLAGTGGILHVRDVYLNGLKFIDLKLIFDCGQVIDYTCGNFEKEEDNRRYIEDNILFHHPKIAMGEFAIGTNTTAYMMAKKYQIEDRLPILIAEKLGPHFAVGDTCYSREEDHAVYNPDGKEIIARDNEISEMRLDDPALAYFGCHTDITLSYDELGSLSVIDDEGETIPIIENGRYVLPGTEELNEPFDCK